MFETFPFLLGKLGRGRFEALAEVCVYLRLVEIFMQLRKLGDLRYGLLVNPRHTWIAVRLRSQFRGGLRYGRCPPERFSDDPQRSFL